MAQIYSTGPAYLYVSVVGTQGGMESLLSYPANNEIYFLGTSERPPSIKVVPSFIPIRADIGGIDPFDQLFAGETAVTTVLLTKWNESVLSKITSRPDTGGTRGTYTASDIGSPMLSRSTGQGAFCLWVQFPYATTKLDHATQPAAYRFPGTILLGPDDIQAGSPSKRALIFWSRSVYKRSDGTWTLYDHDDTGLPGVPPTNASGQN